MGITKTDFMRGMQCPRMLWLDRHRPGLRVIPPETQARLDTGNVFGDRAMGMFGPYEEMTVYRPGTDVPDKAAMIERTRERMEAGAEVLCEAAFSNYNNYCAVDILRRTPAGYDMYEVKNAGEVRPQFVKDAAFQYYILLRCGVRVGKAFLVLRGETEEEPFRIEEVTREVRKLYSWINDHIWELNRVKKAPEEIRTEPGPQCTDPYPCWYWAYCHGEPARDEDGAEAEVRLFEDAAGQDALSTERKEGTDEG